ncbi:MULTISPECIES: PTS sugar transporter subunit IIA [unclassified Peribacillus]|uniref:PTS sugar transporter subunit IIA n=1 Tax=unclassified Peribacillus TaxID=2675266 RepID=UPI001F4EDA85|nr:MULTISPECIES: PTS mannose transporter subunit IIA [unclassified Peribacillus]MCK1986040.1 PTS mannose transporter subunit IIA [Peribacillus sp. Aquil_B1]MCK2011338.1 PTS mannose transporter subunit IIA [Peribacillus sp. Aquil_B8]
MKKLLLASHGYLAQGILNSVHIIMGDVEHVDTLCAYVDKNNDIDELVDQKLKQMKEDSNSEWIVITDIFGGSVNNTFMSKLDEHNFYLISGLNLALLIDLLSNININKSTKELIEHSLELSRGTIKYCNELRNSKIAEEDF